MLEKNASISFILDFKLDQVIPLTELHTSCLPFVMETSTTHKVRKVTVRSWGPNRDGGLSIKAECQLCLQDLRCNVAKALLDLVLLDRDRFEPEIWINGLGQVVEVQARPFRSSGTQSH
jgi:hypothetical protein